MTQNDLRNASELMIYRRTLKSNKTTTYTKELNWHDWFLRLHKPAIDDFCYFTPKPFHHMCSSTFLCDIWLNVFCSLKFLLCVVLIEPSFHKTWFLWVFYVYLLYVLKALAISLTILEITFRFFLLFETFLFLLLCFAFSIWYPLFM